MTKTIIHALIACALGVALGLLPDGARAQSMDGWKRLSDVEKFKADYEACSIGVLHSLGEPPGYFARCMRARGWVKP